MTRITRFTRAALSALLASLILVLFGAPEASAGRYTVTSTNDGGNGTLRAAINFANANAPPDTIVFSPGLGTITVSSELPPLTDNATCIFGETGPASLTCTLGLAVSGISVAAESCVVRGMTIRGFTGNAAIQLRPLGNPVRYNHIGGTLPSHRNVLTSNVTGVGLFGMPGIKVERDTVLNCRIDQGTFGIVIDNNARANVIGGLTGAERNVITRTSNDAILVSAMNDTTIGNLIVGNLVGTDESRSTGLGSTGASGIHFKGGLCFANVADSNLVVGHAQHGILMDVNSSANQACRNRVGYDGEKRNSNRSGIYLYQTSNNVIGPLNVACGNTEHGIVLEDASINNLVIKNLVGVDSTGMNEHKNLMNGIYVLEGQNRVVENTVSGNLWDGIRVTVPGNFFESNMVGTDRTGTVAIPNGMNGIRSFSDMGMNTILGNVIAGNMGVGVVLDAGSSGHIIRRNSIGVGATGGALPNAIGMVIHGDASFVGGTMGDGNVISHNSNEGVLVEDDGGVGGDLNVLWGNTIESNGGSGIRFAEGAQNNWVGNYYGTSTTAGNVIRSNLGDGVTVGQTNCSHCPLGNRILSNSIHHNGDKAIDILSSNPDGNSGIPSPTITGANRVAVWGNTNLGGLTTTIQLYIDSDDQMETFVDEFTVTGPTWSHVIALPSGRITATNTAAYPLAADPVHTSQRCDGVIIEEVPVPEPETFSGIVNSALGGAIIGKVPAGSSVVHRGGFDVLSSAPAAATASESSLVVSNLDASGTRGVSLALGASAGGSIRFESLPSLSGISDSTEIAYYARGTVNGTPDQAIGNLRVTDSGAIARLSIDFSAIAAESSRVELWSNDVLKYSGMVANGQAATVDELPIGCLLPLDKTVSALPGHPDQTPVSERPGFMLEFAHDVHFLAPGSPSLVGNEVRFFPDLGVGLTSPVNDVHALELRIKAVPGPGALTHVTLSGESVRQFARGLEGLGQAVIDARGRHDLRVTHIGSSGEDGIAWGRLPLDLESGVRWNTAPLASAAAGAKLELRVDGTSNGTPVTISSTVAKNLQGYFDIFAFFGSTGSPRTVAVYDDGVEVARWTGLSGSVVARASEWPAGCGFTDVNGGWSRVPSMQHAQDAVPQGYWDASWDNWFRFPFPREVTIQSPSGTSVTGDEVRVTSEDESEAVFTGGFALVAANLPNGELSITGAPNALDLGSLGTLSAVGNATVTDDDRLGQYTITSLDGGSKDPGFLWNKPSPAATAEMLFSSYDGTRGLFLPTGASIELIDRALVHGESVARPMGSVAVNAQGQVTADLSTLGSGTMTVRAYDHGALVAQRSGVPNGIAGIVEMNSTNVTGMGSSVASGRPSYWVKVPPGSSVTLGPQGAVTADMILVTPENPTVVIDGIGGLELETESLPYVVITGLDSNPQMLDVTPRTESRVGSMQLLGPNPFRTNTRVAFELARQADVKVEVFSPSGRRVVTLAEGRFEPGRHELTWNGADQERRPLPPGVYWMRLQAPGLSASRKVVRIN